jgi:putative endonuclease
MGVEGRVKGGVNLGRWRSVKPAMNRAGARAEELCAELLRRAGLRVLARNWRCRHGEIDLVAEEGRTLVFAEVRYRRDERFGGAAESVAAAKRARLVAAARLYLARRPDAECRFDVLLLDALEASRVQWIRNAFTA